MNVPSTLRPAPCVDPDAIRSFCNLVFGYLEGFVPIRFISEKGTPTKPVQSGFKSVANLADHLIQAAPRAAEGHRAVFVVPGTVDTASTARAEDVQQTGVLLVDLDIGDIPAKRAHLIKSIGTPSLEVASGGTTDDGMVKAHLYWRLSEAAKGVDAARVADLRGEIATKVGGDTSFARLHQPIRVAGTIHGKNGVQSAVRILAQTSSEYELDDLAEAVLAMPRMAGLSPRVDTGVTIAKGPGVRSLAVMPVREGGVDGITRFAAMSKVIGHWVRNVRVGVCDRAAAWDAIVDHNAAMIQPPWEEDRLRRDFDRLCAVDVKNHGPMPSTVDGNRADQVGDTAAAPSLSDDALASTFVALEGPEWRYVPAWKAWFHWDGHVWTRDQIGRVRQQMRLVCRRTCHGLTPGEARRLASEKTVTAALKLVGSDPLVATAADAWDQDRMLLNTIDGVLDLETGVIQPPDPTLLMTQITSAAVGKGCLLWLTFLNEITDGDLDLQGYLQRLAGYGLTGVTTEQMFAFLHGQGANGKSVFLAVLAHVLGTYAATATLDTFTASRAQRHLTELAGLRAARLVLVPETESGQAWAEARIKSVTGGEKIRANFMHQDHFEFQPQFKLIVAGNHRPSLSNVGESMRRRLHMVPFTVTIPQSRRDQGLTDKLIAERDGILGWMVQGCLKWQQQGLHPPACILDAAEDYFASEDLIGQWLEVSCRQGPQAKELSAALYQSWKAWSDERGFDCGSQRSLGEDLRARGFKSGKIGPQRARGWLGLTLHRGTPGGEGDE